MMREEGDRRPDAVVKREFAAESNLTPENVMCD